APLNSGGSDESRRHEAHGGTGSIHETFTAALENPPRGNRMLRHFRCIVVTVSICAMISNRPMKAAEPSSRYNFVVILADDLGAAELACYGNHDHQTPHLDRLAHEGMRFRTCYSTPICSPSRVMLMTGRYGFRTGWYNFIGRPGSPTYKND